METILTPDPATSAGLERGRAGVGLVTTARVSAVVGSLMVAIGIFVPSGGLAAFLRGTADPPSGQLILGATLFRIGLVVLGLVVIALGNVRIWKPVAPGDDVRSAQTRRLATGILALILLAAAALRLYGLNSGLWLDEILTDVLYAHLPYGAIVTTFDSENQHFLYSLLAHASIQTFGDSAWALRVPAVVFGVGSIWALYLLGSEVANAVEGLFAAALLTFSYTHVWFSQDARGYSGLLCLATLSSWLFLRALQQGSPRRWLIYAMAAALGMYVHVTMLFVLVAHFLIYARRLVAQRRAIWPNRWAGLFLGFGFGALLTFQLYALVLPEVAGGMGREQSVVTAWKNPIWTLLEVARGMQANFAGGVVAVGALVIFGAGLLSYVRTKPELIELLVVPAVVGAAVVMGLGHHLWPRFFLFAMGFGALVVIRGAVVWGHLAARVLRLPDRASAWIGAVLCAGLVLASARSLPAAYQPKQDYAGAAQFVSAHEQPGDAVVVTGIAAFPYLNLYHEPWPEVESVTALDAIRAKATRTWLIYSFPPVLAAEQPEIMDTITREFHVVKQFNGTVDGGAIIVCRAEGAPGALASR